MEWLSIIMTLMNIAPEVKKYIDTGVNVATALSKSNPKVIPILENAGSTLFPQLAGTIHAVAAAADAIFNPNGTQWLQTSLNTLAKAGLEVDGSYGPKTKAAVETFQKAHQPAAGPIDGWAGPKTNAVIKIELAKLNPAG